MALSVSIIVPVYNVENYIKDCFQSIVNQTYSGPMESLFIDDCGTDNSIEVLKGLMAEYDGPINMRLLHHDKNRGLSAARNTGISYSQGEYIFFLDSDDQLYPGSIAGLARAAIDEELPDLILGSYQVNIPDHVINRYKYKYEVLDNHLQIVKAFLKGDLYCMAPNKLIRHDFISKNQLDFKEGIIHEDNLWSFQSYHLAQTVVTTPETTYYYMIHDESIMSSTDSEKRLLSCKVIYDEVVNDINSNRYLPVDNLSIDYVKELMDTRCFRLIDEVYHHPKVYCRKRLQELELISDKYNQWINEFWQAPTLYLKLLKKTFKNRLFFLFDFLMMMGKLKSIICQRFL